MIIRGSETSLKKFALKQGVELDSLDPRGLLALMMDWYVSERVTDARPIEESGDGLLVQWGTYSFGGPETFQYDVTRQFIAPDRRDPDDSIYWQLSVTAHFAPEPATADLQDSRWIFDPAEIPVAREELASSPVLDVLDGKPVENVDVYLGQV